MSNVNDTGSASCTSHYAAIGGLAVVNSACWCLLIIVPAGAVDKYTAMAMFVAIAMITAGAVAILANRSVSARYEDPLMTADAVPAAPRRCSPATTRASCTWR